MLVSLKWLRDYVDIDMDVKEFADKMTMTGTKVETIDYYGEEIENILVGKILEIKQHPNADKLVVTKVDIGDKVVQIVTGATNISEGDYIPVAVNGSKLPGGVEIKQTDFRGELSDGMMCSAAELGIDEHYIEEYKRGGIYILDHEDSYELGKDIKDLKIVTCHLGNGASIAAVDGGKCVDTSMGFTPLEGLIMGTRCGDIDPAILPFLMRKEGLDADGLDKLMNKESGVYGMTGISSDFRDIEDAAKNGDERAQATLEAYVKKVQKYIGAYAAEMNGLDVVVFTAGVGENGKAIRADIASNMEFLGMKLDKEANDVRGKETVISTADSKVKMLLIPTNEELMIARDTLRLVK